MMTTRMLTMEIVMMMIMMMVMMLVGWKGYGAGAGLLPAFNVGLRRKFSIIQATAVATNDKDHEWNMATTAGDGRKPSYSPLFSPPPTPLPTNTFHDFPEYMANKAIGMFINTQKFEDDFIFQIPNSLPELPPPCVCVCEKGRERERDWL